MSVSLGRQRLKEFVERIGVPAIRPSTSPFDPGYDLPTLVGHLDQCAHLMSTLKISMACWMIADEAISRGKIAAARAHRVKPVAGGGPFEIAAAHDQLPAYLDLCADMGFARIECGQGFTDVPLDPARIVAMARERGLETQFELGSKHAGPFTAGMLGRLIDHGRSWLDAGARQVVVEARESAREVGLFDQRQRLNGTIADRLANAFGLDLLVFEAPTKASQFSLLDHFGPEVQLANVRLEELLRVEIYRRGLHADAFAKDKLRRVPGRADGPARARAG
jgi:phosphosulfolactate synthase